MQKDFHFYAIYALARAGGFTSDRAFIVAYCSQHTDDAKYEHTLSFENGGRFQQVLTAHQYLHLKALNKATCYRIWVPFHFLPGNHGVGFYERMVTRPGSTVAQRLIDGLLASSPKPYLLHHLGIFLHCYADSWAHQNFIGDIKDNLNDVRRIRVKGLTGTSLRDAIRKLKTLVVEYAAPKLGHAQAGTIPDEPCRQWQYEDHLGRKYDISNVERCLDAAQNCYRLMGNFHNRHPGLSQDRPLPWHQIASKIRELFETEDELKNREKVWKQAIADGQFCVKADDGDKYLDYDDRLWFKDAVTVFRHADDPHQPDQYERKPGFETSNWKFFHDAAALHRFTVLHEALSEHGIICG